MPKGLRTECIVDGRRVRYETSDDFTRIVSADNKGHRNIRLYGYGWEIRKTGYYYHLRWYRGESGGDILRMRSAESAKGS